MSKETPRIYVACLASYNAGILHGAWVEVAPDPWEIWDAITTMLKSSPIVGAEEFAIHDYEGFGPVRIEEYAGIERVAQIAAFVTTHGELGAELLNYYGGDLGEAREAIAEHYLGCFTSLADYVQDTTEECISVPEPLRFYIDWTAMARDAERSGDVFTIETGFEQVHVFAGC